MNTVKNLFQHLPFGHIKLMFFRKLVTKTSLDFNKSYNNFDD